MRLLKCFLLGLTVVVFTGCQSATSLLFYPGKGHVRTPADMGLDFEPVVLTASDGTRLVNWWLPAQGRVRGSILFLHGNAENISTHIGSVAWLPAEGFGVFLLDYRGFGESAGEPGLPEVMHDIQAAHAWMLQMPRPHVLFGQSIGGALGLRYHADYRESLPDFDGLLIESAPASYPRIGREVMAGAWLTWPFQWLPWLIMPADYDADDAVARIDAPLLLMHGREDPVVGFPHSETLLEKAREAGVEVIFLDYPNGHIRGFAETEIREQALRFFADPQGGRMTIASPLYQ